MRHAVQRARAGPAARLEHLAIAGRAATLVQLTAVLAALRHDPPAASAQRLSQPSAVARGTRTGPPHAVRGRSTRAATPQAGIEQRVRTLVRGHHQAAHSTERHWQVAPLALAQRQAARTRQCRRDSWAVACMRVPGQAPGERGGGRTPAPAGTAAPAGSCRPTWCCAPAACPPWWPAPARARRVP